MPQDKERTLFVPSKFEGGKYLHVKTPKTPAG